MECIERLTLTFTSKCSKENETDRVCDGDGVVMMMMLVVVLL